VNTINVGIIGVGNCASSLVQGVTYYADPAGGRAGLTNAVCAGYVVSDVRFTSAFDVESYLTWSLFQPIVGRTEPLNLRFQKRRPP
jgi:myo-inositol-1-phosphate synthase